MPPPKSPYDLTPDAPSAVLREDGMEADIGKEHAYPPFNDSYTALRGSAFHQSEAKPQAVSEAKDNFRKDDDVRWQPSGARSTAKSSPQGERGGVHQFGVPPKGNANFAWVQHFIHHLAPQGMAGFVLANGSMSSNQSGDRPARSASSKPKAKPQSLPRRRDIRRALIEVDLVDTALRDSAFPQSEAILQVLSAAKNNMVALPGQLFYSTQIPVCLWFLAKSKAADAKRGFRDRRQQTLFIDARKLGTLSPQLGTGKARPAFQSQLN